MASDSKKQQRVTITQVAAALGVAVSTVSNAYNRPDQLSEALRKRILETAAELGYAGPQPLARSLRQQRAGAIGLLFAERLPYVFSDPAALLLMEGLVQTLEASNMGLLLIPGRIGHSVALKNALVDGFVLYALTNTHPLVELALKRRLPTVMIDQIATGDAVSILVHDFDGARQAAQHLIDLGHRRFGVIFDRITDQAQGLRSGASISPLADLPDTFLALKRRFEGYAAAFEQEGIDWNQQLFYECSDNSEAAGAEAMQAILRSGQRPTALLCLTDRLALGAMEVAQRAGLRIPQDLSIVGYDDIPAAAQSRPSLTTVQQDHRAKGRLAGECLLALLQGHAFEQPDPLESRLILRESSGPPL